MPDAIPTLSTQTQLILGFDPGRDKCGLAVVGSDRRPRQREIVPSAQAIERVKQLRTQMTIPLLVLGDQTTAQYWKAQLTQAFPDCTLVLIDERNSSLEARQRYWDYNPARGLSWLLPRGMRVPPQPYDDIVAQILVERYLDKIL